MSLLRRCGNFREVDELSRMQLSPSPEAWSGHRIDDQLREGLHILVDDGEFDGECWVARIVPYTGIWGKRSAPPPLIHGVEGTAGGAR